MAEYDDDRPVFDVAETAAAGGAIVCRDCGSGFDHVGRGRPPVRCTDCRGSSRKAGQDGPSEPNRPKAVAQLKNNIHGQLSMLGMGLMFVDPFDGQLIMQKAEKIATVLSNLAATNPSIRKGLENGVELAGWGPVLLLIAEVGIPIMAHHGLIRGVPDPAKKGPMRTASPQPDPQSMPVWTPGKEPTMATADPYAGSL